MKNVQTWRFKDVAGYLLLLGVGVCIGVIYGHLVVRGVLYLLSPNALDGFLESPHVSPYTSHSGFEGAVTEAYDWIGIVTESEIIVTACYRCAEALGAFWLGGRIVEAQSRYYNLARLKMRHRLTFFQVREMNPLLHNRVTDMLWAISYILAEIFLPQILSIGFGWLIVQFFWDSYHWFSLIPAFFAARWISVHFAVIVYKLFHRFDLEQDLEDAPLMLNAMAHMQAETEALGNGAYGDPYSLEADNSSLF